MKKLISLVLLISLAFSLDAQRRYGKESRKDLRERSPNRAVLQLGGGVFSDYTNDWDPGEGAFDNPLENFKMSNVTYSAMLGLRSGFNSDNYNFSSNYCYYYLN